ncbi:TauD/TfdA family dioxygenase, partial [Niveispirillum sp.]|uniref:TauD/TfdA dioxygenase family protein n=1 Tax=Niveispirillum sp. TaxID=1917217 RepID=UPI001B50E835
VEEISPHTGSLVQGLDLSEGWEDATMARLISLLHQRGVLVIRGQRLDDAAYIRFGRCWGNPLEFFIAEHRGQNHPEMITISNDPATPPAMRDGAVHWHSDGSYEAEPAAVTMLYGRLAPDEGGETLFANTAAAFDALPPTMQAQLLERVAIHELGAAPWIAGETVPDPSRPKRKMPYQRHPLIIRHPVTGRRAIYASGTAFAIDGMPADEGRALIQRLRAHVAEDQFRITWKVAPGDIVLWDNFSTVHSATPIDYSDLPGKQRLLYRISTRGLPDLCRAPAQ